MNPVELVEQFKRYSVKEKLLLLLLLLYPTVAVSVKNGGIAILAVFVILSLFGVREKRGNLDRDENHLLLGYVSFFLFAALTLFYTEDINMGVQRVERLSQLAFLLPVFMLFRKYPAGLAMFFLYGVVVASFVMGLQAAYVIDVLGEDRARSALNAIGFGDLAVLNASILVVALFTVCRARMERNILLAAILFALYAAVESKARGAWVYVPVFSMMMISYWWKQSSIDIWWKLIAVMLLLITGAGALQLPAVSERIDMAVGEIRAYDGELDKSYSSVRARLQMWEASIEIWKENPILGTGIGDYWVDKNKLIDKLGFGDENFERYDHAHSIYFETLAGMGGVGLLLLILAIIVLPARSLYLKFHEARCATSKFIILSGITVIVAFAVFGLTESWLARKSMLSLYVVYTVIFLAAARQTVYSES